MAKKKIQVIPRWNYWVVLILGVAAGLYSVSGRTKDADIILIMIAPHFSVLTIQTFLLLFISRQVMRYRSAANMIGVRRQTEYIQKRLVASIIVEVTLYFLGFYSTFVFAAEPIFIDGGPVLGITILLLRYLVIMFLAVILVGVYQVSYPGTLTVFVMMVALAYHYIIEMNYLLIAYSPLYDPLYRAMHQIYRV